MYTSKPEETIQKNRSRGQEFETVYKNIFYDTDYISEDQTERLRLCQKCGGFRVILSSAQHRSARYYEVYCISVPAFCCDDCHQQAIDMYQQMCRQLKYDYVYLQDRIKD